jgi:hypothetical protein
MRRSWPALAATVPLVLGWAVATARPAAASAPATGPAAVQPGGGLGSGGLGSGTQNSVVSSSNWAGYVAAGSAGTFTSVSANWT